MSLLFLIFGPWFFQDACSYFTLFLKNGRIHFRVQNNNAGNLRSTSFTSKAKCNEGRKDHIINIKKNLQQFFIAVTCNGGQEVFRTEKGKFSFRTKKANYYLGGVPPLFKREKCVDIQLKSYVGFLEPQGDVYNNPALMTSHGTMYSTDKVRK